MALKLPEEMKKLTLESFVQLIEHATTDTNQIKIQRITNFDWDILTDREMEILSLMVKGKENKDIAHSLTISEKTVKNHVSNILGKIKVNNRTQAVVKAFQTNLVRIT